MNVDQFQQTNAIRGRRWHQGDLTQWSELEWAGAMCGEAGETNEVVLELALLVLALNSKAGGAANVAKKIRRLDLSLPNREAGLTQNDSSVLREKLGDEIGDMFIYGLLLLSVLGFNASEVIGRVFDRKSVEYGFPERAEE